MSNVKEIPMTSVLDRLGMQYKHLTWPEYVVIEGWKIADGWTFNTDENLMFNHTPWKDYRPKGSNIDLVMWREKIDTDEAIERLMDKFDLKKDKVFKKKELATIKPTTASPMKALREKAPSVPSEWVEYLATRWIEYNKVKNIVKRSAKNKALALALYKWPIKWIQMRLLTPAKIVWEESKWDQRFLCVKWTDWDAVYLHDLDTTQDHIYVVEWFMDFLTLRQYTGNVIGLRSAKNWIDEVNRYWKTHEIVIVADNDDAGNEVVENIQARKKSVVKFMDWMWGDLNEAYLNLKEVWEQDKIVSYLQEWKQEIIQEPSDRERLMSIGYQYPDWPFEYEFGCLKWGELVMVAAPTNVWKTTFIVMLIKKNTDHWKNIWMINMEFDLDDWFRYDYLRTKWYKDNQIKMMLTDLWDITEEMKAEMEEYVIKRRSEIDITQVEQGTSVQEVFETIERLRQEGKTAVVIDSFAWIWNCSKDIKEQDHVIKQLRNYVTETWMLVILVHHFNKWGKEYAWSATIKYLCNVVIGIRPACTHIWVPYRLFTLEKDKSHSEVIEAHTMY